jgi:hypothetical protein
MPRPAIADCTRPQEAHRYFAYALALCERLQALEALETVQVKRPYARTEKTAGDALKAAMALSAIRMRGRMDMRRFTAPRPCGFIYEARPGFVLISYFFYLS